MMDYKKATKELKNFILFCRIMRLQRYLENQQIYFPKIKSFIPGGMTGGKAHGADGHISKLILNDRPELMTDFSTETHLKIFKQMRKRHGVFSNKFSIPITIDNQFIFMQP